MAKRRQGHNEEAQDKAQTIWEVESSEWLGMLHTKTSIHYNNEYGVGPKGV